MKVDAAAHFRDRRVCYDDIFTFGTPRRLTLCIPELSTRQAPAREEALGPPRQSAYDGNGNPSKAARGFAAAQGVNVDALVIRRTPKGEYVASVKHHKGCTTFSLLPNLCVNYLESLSFPKAMRWNSSGVRFARPIRWIVALYGGRTIPFSYAGIKAGRSDLRTSVHDCIRNKEPAQRDNSAKLRILCDIVGKAWRHR